jgi:hypothetical protein
MSTTATPTPTRPAAPTRQKLPAGYRWSDVWRDTDGNFVQGEVEAPVDGQWNIAGRLFVCPADPCDTAVWTLDLTPNAKPDPSCCSKHPTELLPAPLQAGDQDLVGAAHNRVVAYVAGVLARRRDQVVQRAEARIRAAQQAAMDASRRTAADMRGHVPSLIASGGTWAGAGWVVAQTDPAVTAAIGGAVGTAGCVAAYVLAYLAQKWRARRDGVDLVGRAGRRVRARARHIGAGPLAAGVWTLGAAVTGIYPATAQGALWLLVAAPLLAWLVNRSHWDKLWADRRRLRELARQRAEDAVRRIAEEAEKALRQIEAPAETVTAAQADTPEAMGAWMAAEWVRIAASDTVPIGFPMSRTSILVEETREITAPVDGVEVRIGWEFAIRGEPGALVARMGGQSPLVAAREWLASMLERDPNTVELVDRPGGQVNRGLLLLTDKAPLGGAVKWKGRDGIRVDSSGAIYAHIGRSIVGDDVEEALYLPGQPFGGMDVGHTGGGKGVGTILALLNALAAQVIFPVLHDPKQLLDYADFCGVFPIGVTDEHRDVIVQSLHAERIRREAMLSTQTVTDRHGRQRRQQARWDTAKHGPLVWHFWDEFHLHALAKAFLLEITKQQRLQRAAGMGGTLISQGGGLADFGDSVLRGLLNQVRLRLYRMPDNLAMLAGYKGAYMPSQLPRLPGMCLTVSDGAPPLPLRTAFVTREIDADDSVYDQLFAPDGTPLLTAPTLPAETVAVWERTGLMDLWRLGQGPDGLDKLLSDTPAPEGLTPTAAQVAAGNGPGKLLAEDVILAILQTAGGACPRSDIDGNQTWLRPAAGGTHPAPSTVSRAGKKLETEQLIKRGDGVYRLLDAGQERAKLAVMALLIGGPGPAPAAKPDPTAATAATTPAEVERQAEVTAEANA